MDRDELISDGWYPDTDKYWVPPSQAGQRPYRYGDLFNVPTSDVHGVPLRTPSGSPWHAALILTPSCELGAKAKPATAVEIAAVVPLLLQPQDAQAAITTGWQEKDGRVMVAYAHTVFLAPAPVPHTHDEPMFANLKDTRRVRFDGLTAAGRIAALDHDARVHVIRRELYFRYRWLVPTEDVFALERDRISNDPAYAPPAPLWATPGGAEFYPAPAAD